MEAFQKVITKIELTRSCPWFPPCCRSSTADSSSSCLSHWSSNSQPFLNPVAPTLKTELIHTSWLNCFYLMYNFQKKKKRNVNLRKLTNFVDLIAIGLPVRVTQKTNFVLLTCLSVGRSIVLNLKRYNKPFRKPPPPPPHPWKGIRHFYNVNLSNSFKM